MAVARERRLVEDLQSDLRSLSNETKRRFPPVKEAAESAVMKLRTLIPSGQSFNSAKVVALLKDACSDFMQPFIMGCDTRCVQVIQLCLSAIQRMITHEIIDGLLSANIVNMLWQLFDQSIEEVHLRLLQTVVVLVTTKASKLHSTALARAIVLCFRLHFTKNEVTNNTAEASVRQTVSVVFDRVIEEDKKNAVKPWTGNDYLPKSSIKFSVPPNSTSAVADAYLLFQDLCQLVNADNPYWLIGITEMTRTFGLELLESVLLEYESIFEKHPEFKFLLKDRVCALVIRLFSPNIKHRQGASPPPSGLSSSPGKDKPYFPISMRLLRVVSILLKKYYQALVTESEIFLSLLIKFLDTDKPTWQRALAIEVIYQLCAHPQLLKSFCVAYDMQAHSTKIFRNLVSSLSTFIQNLFVQVQANSGSATLVGSVSENSLGPMQSSHLSQHHFEYHGAVIPLMPLVLDSSGSVKFLHLDMLDKAEPAPVPDGYLLSMAYHSILDLVRGLTAIIDTELNEVSAGSSTKTDVSVLVEMLSGSWCSILSVLSLLLDAGTDESCIENVLKCIETFAGVCGQLKLGSARDAFITVLCKASLPMHYIIPVLMSSMPHLPQKIYTSDRDAAAVDQHVVAVGNSYPHGSTNSTGGSVSLTAKNVQCMRTILSFAHCYGAYINTAWQLILTTLQHLVWILGLKPDSSGQLKANTRSGGDSTTVTSTVLTTAVLGDLPILTNMLTKLFEASQYLDDVALHHLINALCSLSIESMDAAYNSNIKEPSLFAVAKLLETGLVNMKRIEILWRPVTGHLLEVCQHPNGLLREWGAEGVSALVKAALKHYQGDQLSNNARMLHMFLLPLKEISSSVHIDVRLKQLDSILQILHFCGDSLGTGWPEILKMIGSATENSSETLVRLGFRSVQLIISDYILSLPASSLSDCIDVVAKYAEQMQDFNISLTAIGLLWSMADFMHQSQEKLGPELKKLKEKGHFNEYAEIPAADALWMILFCKIGQLCMDARPAVRKSAGQTLFSTLSAHWSTISKSTWHEVTWKVLFSLMDDVHRACSLAPTDRNTSTSASILMHHSRDTEEKQWQETSVLTLAGIARVFKTKRAVLLLMNDFESAWDKILDYIQASATDSSCEISRAALCSFEDILHPTGSELSNKNNLLWKKAWNVWCSIGITVTMPPPPGQTSPDEMLSQAYLTSLIQLFPVLHGHLYESFCTSDFKQLAAVLKGVVCVPVRADATAFILPTSGEVLTPLQEAVVNAVDLVQKSVSAQSDILLYPAIFDFLLSIVDFASNSPSYGDIKSSSNSLDKNSWVCVNYINFAEYSMKVVVDLYQITASHKSVIQYDILTTIIKTLHVPIKKRYNTKPSTTWQLAVNAFIKVLQAGLPVVRQHSKVSLFENLWDELANCMENFLFPTAVPPVNLSVEEHRQHESFDLLLIELIRNEILPYRTSFPKPFLTKLVALMNKGSIPLSTREMDLNIGNARSRDEVSKQCFSTLFQFSMLPSANGNPAKSDDPQTSEFNEVTVASLLQRCRSSLTQYVTSDRLKTRFPFPEAQLKEVMFALKALDALLQSMNKTSKPVEESLWRNIVDLYPVLIDCITTDSSEVRLSVAQVLSHFQSHLVLNNATG